MADFPPPERLFPVYPDEDPAMPTLPVRERLAAAGAWLLARLNEKSTWAGLITLASTITGMGISPAHADAIATLGSVVASTILVLVKTK